MLKEVGNVDLSYNLTKEELCAKISLCDALIVRSATKVRRRRMAGGWRAPQGGRAGVAAFLCPAERQASVQQVLFFCLLYQLCKPSS